jgi:hypothetical protein
MDNYLFIQSLNLLTKILAKNRRSDLHELNLVQIVYKLIRIDQAFGFDCSNEWKTILGLTSDDKNRNQVKTDRYFYTIQLFFIGFLFSSWTMSSWSFWLKMSPKLPILILKVSLILVRHWTAIRFTLL